MLAEWSAECSPEDPVLVVPWSDPSSGERHFIDLRENPYDLDHIPEAEQNPPLMQALRALNAPRSPVFTAKCDAWPLAPGTEDAEAELSSLRLNLDMTEEHAPAGFSSYIDILWRERPIFLYFHQHEQLMQRLTRLAGALEQPTAMLDCVIRPALIDFTGPQEGFAVSLYIKALGADQQTAWEHWGYALEAVVALLRQKDFAPS